jgi:mannose-1-phosphate guanylyltransferase
MKNSLYGLILAGGTGERFWPLSRRSRPKQLLQLISTKTLLEETVARLDGLVPQERILVLTNVDQEAALARTPAEFATGKTLLPNRQNATRPRPSHSPPPGSRCAITAPPCSFCRPIM